MNDEIDLRLDNLTATLALLQRLNAQGPDFMEGARRALNGLIQAVREIGQEPGEQEPEGPTFEIYQENLQQGEIPAPAGIDPGRWASRMAPEHPYWALPPWAMVALTPGWKEGEALVTSVEALIMQDEFLPEESCQIKVFSALESPNKIQRLSLAELVMFARLCEVSLDGLKLRIGARPRPGSYPQPSQSDLSQLIMLQRHMSGQQEYDVSKCRPSVLKVILRRRALPTSLVYFLPPREVLRFALGEGVEVSQEVQARQARYDALPRDRNHSRIRFLLQLQSIASISNWKEGKLRLANSEPHWVEKAIAERDPAGFIEALSRVGSVPPPNVPLETYFYDNFVTHHNAGLTGEDLPYSVNLAYLSSPLIFTQEKAAKLSQARVKPWLLLERAVMGGTLPPEPVIRRKVEKISPEGQWSADAEFILSVYHYTRENENFPHEGQDISFFRSLLHLEKLSDRQLLRLGVTPYDSRAKLIANTAHLLHKAGFFLPSWRRDVLKLDKEPENIDWESLGVPEHKNYCRNDSSETYLENSIFGKDIFLVAYGTLRDYRVYELEEIQKAAYSDDAGVTVFRRPDSLKSVIPLSQARKLRDLVAQSAEHEARHPDQWWLGSLPDLEAASFLPWCEDILAKMQDRIDFDDEALVRFRELCPEDQERIAAGLREIFYLGMYFRRWKGPGHAYPLKEQETGPEKGDALPENIDEHTERVRTLLNSLSAPARAFLDGLLVVRYKPDGTLSYSNKDFAATWVQILKGEACIRMASLVLVGTGYHFLDVLTKEKIPGVEVKAMDKIS